MISTFSLKGKKAFVTGSSRGIGRAILLGLAEAGADVIAHGIQSGEAGDSLLAQAAGLGVTARFIPGDLSRPDGGRELATRVLNEAGTVDIAVLNASFQIRNRWEAITSDESARQWQTNFQSSLEIIQILAPPMCERRWGRILAVGSVQQTKPHPEMAVYAATKTAQLSLVRNLASQLAGEGVTVNNLSPGVIPTDRNLAALSDPDYSATVLRRIPMRRFGTPEDCAGVALLLCSEAGNYITGQDFPVDGGMSL